MGGIEKPPPPAAFLPHPKEEKRSDPAITGSAQAIDIDFFVIIPLILSIAVVPWRA
jgi:hypothetical protein